VVAFQSERTSAAFALILFFQRKNILGAMITYHAPAEAAENCESSVFFRGPWLCVEMRFCAFC